MKKFSLAFILTALACVPAELVAGWIKIYGGGQPDRGECVQQIKEGGYIVVGFTASFGSGYDVWLLKTDAKGDTLWTRTYGGNGSDMGYSVDQTNDGGYIIVGHTTSFDVGPENLWLIKTDSIGDTLWTRIYGEEYLDQGKAVQQTNDGGYIIVGRINLTEDEGGLWLLKTDEHGDTLWTHIYAEGGVSWGYSVRQTSDGGYIITGKNGGWASQNLWLLKTDDKGDTLWTRTYGEIWHDEWGKSVQQTTDGGYIIAGRSSGGVWLLKTDAKGDTLWARAYGARNHDWSSYVCQTDDGGYILTGITASFGDPFGDLWLLKTDASGDTVWTRIYGGDNVDWGMSVQQTDDGGYIMVGTGGAGQDLMLIKTDSLGYVVVEEQPVTDVTPSWEATPIGHQIVLKYEDRPLGFHASVFDAAGQKVDELHSAAASGTITWPVTHQFSLGVYFIREIADNPSATRKVVLVR